MIVEDSHFAYLKLQRGALEPLARDRAAWQAAYEASLDADLASMKPFLPERCRSVLDVGSGLGGIDVLLDRHYGGGLEVRLLDGINDPAMVTHHNRTYNDMVLAGDFQRRNGVTKFGYYSTPPHGAVAFDLVVSLQSWCFHYAASMYLDFIRQCCGAGTVLILDVRADKPLWREALRGTFTEVCCAMSRRKFNRIVYFAEAPAAKAQVSG